MRRSWLGLQLVLSCALLLAVFAVEGRCCKGEERSSEEECHCEKRHHCVECCCEKRCHHEEEECCCEKRCHHEEEECCCEKRCHHEEEECCCEKRHHHEELECYCEKRHHHEDEECCKKKHSHGEEDSGEKKHSHGEEDSGEKKHSHAEEDSGKKKHSHGKEESGKKKHSHGKEESGKKKHSHGKEELAEKKHSHGKEESAEKKHSHGKDESTEKTLSPVVEKEADKKKDPQVKKKNRKKKQPLSGELEEASSDSSELYERLAKSERRGLMELAAQSSDVIPHYRKEQAIAHFNRGNEGTYYKHLEDGQLEFTKAMGVMVYVNMVVGKTNCTKTKEEKVAGVEYSRAYLETKGCQLLPQLKPQKHNCTFGIFVDMRTEKKAVVSHTCTIIRGVKKLSKPFKGRTF